MVGSYMAGDEPRGIGAQACLSGRARCLYLSKDHIFLSLRLWFEGLVVLFVRWQVWGYHAGGSVRVSRWVTAVGVHQRLCENTDVTPPPSEWSSVIAPMGLSPSMCM